MNIVFSNPRIEEIDELMAIEYSGFTDEEAASRKAMLERITTINDTFVIAKINNKITGFIVGPASDERYISDDLFDTCIPNSTESKYLTVLSLAVSPQFQKQGIAGKLLKKFIEIAEEESRQAITLTCLDHLIPYYEKFGFVNEGKSLSEHADEEWFNMVLDLSQQK